MKSNKKIPKFKSKADEARFWDTHSPMDYEHEFKGVYNVNFPKPRKRLVSMRLDEKQIQSLKKIAEHKGIGYLTMIRMWITERIHKEHRTIH